MLVLVTGSRNYSDGDFIKARLEAFQERALKRFPETSFTLLSGGARGADRLAEKAARELGWEVEVHEAEWERYGKRAGFIRNLAMVERKPFVCLAFPLGESRGTRHCIEASQKAGVPTFVY